jgi:transcriptional regulator with XRE-family HTH domain
MTIGHQIKSLRLAHNMTQEELAEKLFVTRNAISKWEHNRGTPSIDNIKALSSLFEVSIDALLTTYVRRLSLNKITGFISFITFMMITLYFLPWQTDWSMTLFIAIQFTIYIIYAMILIFLYPQELKEKATRLHLIKVIAFSLSIQTILGMILEW